MEKDTLNILQFEVYGKAPLYRRVLVALRDRFRINPYTNTLLIGKGLKPYIPKLNRVRVVLSVVGAVICIAVPLITPLSIPILLWGLK